MSKDSSNSLTHYPNIKQLKSLIFELKRNPSIIRFSNRSIKIDTFWYNPAFDHSIALFINSWRCVCNFSVNTTDIPSQLCYSPGLIIETVCLYWQKGWTTSVRNIKAEALRTSVTVRFSKIESTWSALVLTQCHYHCQHYFVNSYHNDRRLHFSKLPNLIEIFVLCFIIVYLF